LVMPATNAANALPQNLMQAINLPITNIIGALQTPLHVNAAKSPILDAKILQITPQISTAQPPVPALANLLHGTPKTPVIVAQFMGTTSAQLPVMAMPTIANLTLQSTILQPMQAMTLQFPATGLPQGAFVQLGVI